MMSLATDRGTWTIALIGNPNTGKSTLFGALSGVPQRVGNYPGVTVDKTIGELWHEGKQWVLVDLPGTYSLAPRSPDEMVAVDVLLGRRTSVPVPDVILCVVAADNLERNLYLVSQLLELGRPMVIALSMVDVSQAHGLSIDTELLSHRLGVPVVPIGAHRRIGMEPLKKALAQAAERQVAVTESPFPACFREEVNRLQSVLAAGGSESNGAKIDVLPRYLLERLLLDVGGYIEERLPSHGSSHALREELDAARSGWPRAAALFPPSRHKRGTTGFPGSSTVCWRDRSSRLSPGETASTLCSRTKSGERWSWRS